MGKYDALTRGDLEWLLERTHQLHEAPHLDALGRRLNEELLGRFPAASAIMFHEQGLDGSFCSAHISPELDAQKVETMGRLQHFWHEHPVVGTQPAIPYSGFVYQMSDFLTQSEFERTGLYNECFRYVGARYHLVSFRSFRAGTYLTLGVMRDRDDFTSRDRQLFEVLTPHALAAAKSVTQRERLNGALRVLSAEGRTVGVVRLAGKPLVITSSDESARRLIEVYYGAAHDARLPAVLESEVARAMAGAAWAATDGAELEVEHPEEARRLRVTILGRHGGVLLLLEESEIGVEPTADLLARLSAREAEIANWLVSGKTNIEMAEILGISRRTVEKHLQSIYEKLGVEHRGAAIVALLSRD